MKRIIGLILALCLQFPSWANWAELNCARASGAALASENERSTGQYAPDRPVDILHLLLDILPDFQRHSIQGTAMVKFKPIAQPAGQLALNAVDLEVSSVRSSAAVQAHHVTEDQIVITFTQPIPADEEAWVEIEYSAEPEKGLYFRTPAMGYKEGEAHLFTQGEAIDARHWFPSHDFPNEKFTSEVICHVPEGMIALSNGRMISETKDADTGLVAFRWLQDKPHVNYLISLVAGYFAKIEDNNYKDIPMAFYTSPSDIHEAINSFRDTKDMMAFFEEEIGVPYPWAKYDQVVVRDFMFGGMENTSLTTLTDRTLFTDEFENVRSSQGLVAHELAHQWFGNLVTCKDWSQLWLNEGFATYYAHLYDAHKNGRESKLYRLYSTARNLTERAQGPQPIVHRQFSVPNDFFRQYNHLIYAKGGWVLHMLRSQVGPELFRRCIQSYLERHQFESVVTEDLNSVLEEVTGRSFDRFFDQWVYHGGLPELQVNYHWNEQSKLAKISVQQTQEVNEDKLLFHFPLLIRFKIGTHSHDHLVEITRASEDFYFPLETAPELVRVDPELTLLAKINFSIPDRMVNLQLKDSEDVVGRLIAVEHLAKKKTQRSVELLSTALNQDPFYGVRIEASKALRATGNQASFDALAGSLEQTDARVRLQVVEDLGSFFREETAELLLTILEDETNPEIIARAIGSLSAYPDERVRRALLRSLSSDSYRNLLAQTSVLAMRGQRDPDYLPVILETLSAGESSFTTYGLSSVLHAVAELGRAEENKDPIRQLLLEKTRDPRERVQIAALESLGALEDPKAIPVLETFARASKDNPTRKAAERALAELRNFRKPAEEFKNLRSEILELQKANHDLRRELEELKKQFEASKPAPQPTSQTPPQKPVSRRKGF